MVKCFCRFFLFSFSSGCVLFLGKKRSSVKFGSPLLSLAKIFRYLSLLLEFSYQQGLLQFVALLFLLFSCNYCL